GGGRRYGCRRLRRGRRRLRGLGGRSGGATGSTGIAAAVVTAARSAGRRQGNAAAVLAGLRRQQHAAVTGRVLDGRFAAREDQGPHGNQGGDGAEAEGAEHGALHNPLQQAFLVADVGHLGEVAGGIVHVRHAPPATAAAVAAASTAAHCGAAASAEGGA